MRHNCFTSEHPFHLIYMSNNTLDSEMGSFRLDVPLPLATIRPRKSRRATRFLKGPVPWDWLCAASKLPGKAVHLGIAIWHLAGLKKTETIRIPAHVLEEMGLDRATAYRARKALAHARLISVATKPGKKAQITILATVSHRLLRTDPMAPQMLSRTKIDLP